MGEESGGDGARLATARAAAKSAAISGDAALCVLGAPTSLIHLLLLQFQL